MEQKVNINIEVAYASKTLQRVIALEVPLHSTVMDAILASSMLSIFPEINLTQQKVGIFGRLCELTEIVKAGDRIEIYRPLLIDPKEARRVRANNGKK